MKNLRTKLVASVVMLLIASIMMGVSSFAWFTISTNPEIAGLTTSVIVNENLEIALNKTNSAPGAAAIGDSTKMRTYGNLVNLGYARTTSGGAAVAGTDVSAYGSVNKVLRPCTLATSSTTLKQATGATTAATAATAGTFYYPVYGNDGRIDYMAALDEIKIPSATSGEESGFGYLVAKKTGTDAATAAADGTVTGGKVYGYFMDLYVRTNIAGDLLISDGQKRSTDGETGLGSYFEADKPTGGYTSKEETLAANIAVAYKLTSTESGATAGTTTALTGSVGTSGDAKCKKTFDTGVKAESGVTAKNDLGTLKADTDYTLRIYVYLEGENVTNAAASINGTTVAGKLNLQFKNSAITTGSMDNQA